MSKSNMKRFLTLLLTLMLVIGGIGFQSTQAAAASSTKVGTAYYTVISAKNLTAEYTKPAKKTCTSAAIPATVKINGKTYKVTSIAANAFKGCSKLNKVTIGANVTKIGKKAFYGCKALTAATIDTTKLTTSSVGANAFKGINAKAVVTVPSTKLSAYKKILKAKGLTGKGQAVKGKGTSSTSTNSSKSGTSEPWQNYDPAQPLPDPQTSGFTIGDYSGVNINGTKVSESVEYGIGDDIQFTAGIQMDQHIYGDWKEETVIPLDAEEGTAYLECGYCGRFFASDTLLGLHYHLMCLGGNYWICPTLDPFDAWHFYPDDDPCRVVYKFMLPEGLSYKEGSLKVCARNHYDITDKNYSLDISGNQITITIDDIKAEPFYLPFDKEAYDKAYADPNSSYPVIEYEGQIIPINVLFSTNFNENVMPVNTVTGSITYSYKGNSKTIDLEKMNIYSASMKINHTDTAGNPLTGGTFTLYAEEAVYPEGSNLATYQWKKVRSGLKSGDVVNGLCKNYYKLVQDTFPDGYKKYITPEFSVGIKTANGVPAVAATDNNSWTSMEVADGVVQVVVKNAKDAASVQIGSKNEGASSAMKNPVPDTETTVPDSSQTDAGQTNTSQSLDVVVTYYQDGVRESSMLYRTNESISSGILNTKSISKRSYAFKGCTLQKITLNGEVIDAVPDYVEIGSVICFYYVSQ